MNPRHFALLLVASVALSWPATANPLPPTGAEIVKPRPKVGLVLSGGGARGAAHIGVIKVLEELRVPIDFIAGSSMGALVGAAYASGTPVKELEDGLVLQDWDRLLTDESPRVDRSFLRKEEDQNRLLRLELGVKRDGIRLPPGAITGQKFDALFSQITRNAPPVQDFDQLPIPFRAVATDAESGTMHVFANGRLVDAMRASMSVPGAIAPYQVGERIYLDGGLTRNLPVDVARQMGADVVIVVNIGTPLLKKQDIQSLVGVSLQMVNILTEQNVRASIESLKKSDHLLSPPLDTIGATDFKLVGDAINIGAATTRAQAQALSALSLSKDAY
ncbi:MAG: patatin-like phospholipase family protein, partial [Betaproteobacteria bacterium]|nr:patatin-like phospholipase family protein [Betaproteobacteria bacterium]